VAPQQLSSLLDEPPKSTGWATLAQPAGQPGGPVASALFGTNWIGEAIQTSELAGRGTCTIGRVADTRRDGQPVRGQDACQQPR
jgi:hypothetical protein